MGAGFSVVCRQFARLRRKPKIRPTDSRHYRIQLRDRVKSAVRFAQGESERKSWSSTKYCNRSSLQEIKTAVTSITDSTIQMSSVVEEQSNVAEHINQQVTDIADGAGRAQQNANETFEASMKLEETTEYLYSLIRRFANDKQ